MTRLIKTLLTGMVSIAILSGAGTARATLCTHCTTKGDA